ncbi:MAG: hypothetical protein V8Q82_05925 [Christensenellales bacterium]
MAQAFPGARLVFDASNKRAVKLMLKTWIKTASIQDVGAYFSVSDARAELSGWSPRLRVSSWVTCWAIMICAIPPLAAFAAFWPGWAMV